MTEEKSCDCIADRHGLYLCPEHGEVDASMLVRLALSGQLALSDARKAGLDVGWPGPRHAAYPAIRIAGKWVKLIDDTCYRHADMTTGDVCDHCGYVS